MATRKTTSSKTNIRHLFDKPKEPTSNKPYTTSDTAPLVEFIRCYWYLIQRNPAAWLAGHSDAEIAAAYAVIRRDGLTVVGRTPRQHRAADQQMIAA